MFAKVPKVSFNNGCQIPIVGLGTYARKSEPWQFRQAVEWAIEAGYRHIDTATMYKNEKEVGEGIANKIKEGLVKREDLFITTKCAMGGLIANSNFRQTNFREKFGKPTEMKIQLYNDKHAEEDVVPALNQSLKDIQLDYIDLYLVHWPLSVNSKGEDMAIDYLETWRGMEQTVKLGLAKSIGVSNFNEEQLERLLKHANIKPVVNQIEINPTLTQHNLVEFCKQKSIIPVAYTPLGLLSEARPEFIGKDVIKTDPKLTKVAEKYGKSKAQIALRYMIQRGIPVLPKSFTKSRIEENINLFDFELNDEEMSIVESFNINHRCVPGRGMEKLTNYPY